MDFASILKPVTSLGQEALSKLSGGISSRVKAISSLGTSVKKAISSAPSAKSAMKSNAQAIDTSFAQTALGKSVTNFFKPTEKVRARDILREIPQATKEMFTPGRGYSESQIAGAKPTAKEMALAVPKIGAEIGVGLGKLSGEYIPAPKFVEKATQTKGGKLITQAADWLENFARPKTAGEAKTMRIADVVSLAPVGSIKNTVKVFDAIAKTDDLLKIEKGLKNFGLSEDVIKAIAPKLKAVTDPVEVGRIVNEAQKRINWRVTLENPQVDVWRKSDILEALANDSKTPQELRDVLKYNSQIAGEIGSKADNIKYAAEQKLKSLGQETKVETPVSALGESVRSELTPTNVSPLPTAVKPANPVVESMAKTEAGQTVQLRKPEEIVKSETLSRLKQTPDPVSIAKIAEQTGQSPARVSKFVQKAREIKTSLLEYFQNTDERVRQLVERPDVKVSDVSNPYQKMTLSHGRIASQLETAQKEVASVMSDIKKSGITRKDIHDFLHYKHAPERNIALGEGAAGITTKEAETGLSRLRTNAKASEIERIATKVKDLHNQSLNLLKESGVITDELFKTLTTKYKEHVPLNRIIEGEDLEKALTSGGYAVRSTGIKSAVGSEKEVSDIITNIIANYEQAVSRAEKNIVDNATAAFVRDNKDILGDSITIEKPKVAGLTFDKKPIYQISNDPRIIPFFENGKKMEIHVKDPALATALAGVGREKLPALLNAVGAFSRLYSGLMTRFDVLGFPFSNKIRDLQETAIYMASQKDVGFKGATEMAVKDTQSVKDIVDSLRGLDTEGTRLYKEMKSMGGTTGGFALSTKKDIALSVDKLEKLANSKTRRIADNLVEYIDNWNSIFEDSTRLSVYKQGLRQGLSKERSAFLAKEASLNFNRMGRGGPMINALYMFANASIQGSVKTVRAFKNPKVLGATSMIVGGAVASANQWNDRVDPDWRDKVSKWDRLNGLPVMIPSFDGKARYFTVPIAWGIKPIKVMADYAYDAVAKKGFNPTQMVEDTLTAVLEAYNPVGGTDLISAMTPTILDVPVSLARNVSWTGKKIHPDNDPNAPADIQYYSSLGNTKTGQAAISISEFLQKNLGASVSPADMKYAFDQYIGGAGKQIQRITDIGAGVATGQVPPATEFPLISRFYREVSPEEQPSKPSTQTEGIKEALGVQSRESFQHKQLATKMATELSALPKGQAATVWQQINAKDKKMAQDISDIVKKKNLGVTYDDTLLKALNVSNGARAKEIYRLGNEMAPAKRQEFLADLWKKKVITKAVYTQLEYLIAHPEVLK